MQRDRVPVSHAGLGYPPPRQRQKHLSVVIQRDTGLSAPAPAAAKARCRDADNRERGPDRRRLAIKPATTLRRVRRFDQGAAPRCAASLAERFVVALEAAT